MPFTKNRSNDDSGLHDLQAMASSAKKRRSQRLSSQMDAQDSLLQSAAALDAVVLPDPNKEQAPVSIADVAVPVGAKASAASASQVQSASVATPAMVAEMSEVKSSSGKGLYVVIALAAAAAAGAYVMLGQKSESASEPAAAPEVAQPVAIAPTEPAPAAEVAPALAVADDSETADQANPEAAPEPTATEPADVAQPAVASADKKATKAEKSSKGKAETPKVEKTKVAAVAKDKKEAKAAAKKDKADSKKAETTVEKKLDDNASMDDILSSVTGGVDKPIADTKVDKGPSKTELGRGDVAKAMKKISPSAKACYSAEEFSGMVTIKYSVGPDGKVSKAKATGAHASSKTGACVVKAVKKAKFPPFSGPTTSFSFPFLLAP